MNSRMILSLAFAACLAGPAHAQTPPASPVAAPAPPPPAYGMPINGDMAQAVMNAAEAEAQRNNWHLSFAIVDTSGNLVMFKMMPDANFITREVAMRKARTAAAFRVPTKVLAEAAAKGGPGPSITQILPEYAALEGGVPIVVGGKIIGAIGASGARSYEDAQAASRGAEAAR